ncbi:MAG: crotonase/enoyl-CoA hydratase family protein [Alicyclobacillus macrosporangiidus]|uniref:crotonase/enoyl-CoA hydratase family protein n=1 Tax=Alicyclobacillus macrosporangiidus TaxID=392015 RepID=UPI0026EEABB3|nr:crotonase/enoyl-CoA hydratase family protein [Alicyclobacillus macrosporangiidus]MCL6600181.1 crotonase/enoyl-CoA hydratase family protein [Alicyclobacillus macrosporangiidus]
MSYETVLFERQGHVAVITMNRPESLNAVNSTMWRELGEALEAFSQENDLWVGVLTGAGEKAFCAGADLKEVAAGGFKLTEQMRQWGFAGIVRHHVPKPLIAAVNGYALGGGTEIALACDLVVASEEAVFGLPEVKRGIVAGGGGLLRLPRQVPVKIAMYAILTGEPLSAEEAARWGLVNQVVPKGQVRDAALAIAHKIAENAPVAVRVSKEGVYRSLDTSLDFPADAWVINEELIMRVMASEDAKEGPRAFAERRKPVWKGR